MKNQPKIIQEHSKLIEYEAGKYDKYLPHNVVVAEAYKIANKALKSYDPDRGTKFSTHLTNQLKKLSRISTTYGSAVRLPEDKQFKLKRLNDAELILKDKLGREPSLFELSDCTSIPIPQITSILQQRSADVNLSTLAHTPVFINNVNDDWLHYVYHDLSDLDRIILEHKTGFGGKKILSNDEIAKLINISTSAVSNRIKMITDKIQENWLGED